MSTIFALLLLVVTACQSSKTIVNGLDERDANEILVLLAQKHIPAYKIEQKAQSTGAGQKMQLWDVAVSSENAVRAMEILSENGLPRVRGPSLLDLFSSTGLVPSDTAENIRYQVGLADTIANMVRKMDGVIDANVELSFPEEDPLNPSAKLPPITASVYVKHTGVLDDPNRHLTSKIKQLASGAISGLSYDNVNVIPDRARFAINPSTLIEESPEEYVQDFGVTIAKTSSDDFQVFFITICLLLLSLILCFIWLSWKLYPILKRRGGISQLFQISPLPEAWETEKEATKEQNLQ
ncbi:MAG: type III secretion inner membrane ring lipoprotein SctJ [Verrucomicrobia bacterium]|nr:type III secretion inner membrane ring lipoprotein SctJ [Verrucomicrobiota bacterium]